MKWVTRTSAVEETGDPKRMGLYLWGTYLRNLIRSIGYSPSRPVHLLANPLHTLLSDAYHSAATAYPSASVRYSKDMQSSERTARWVSM